MDIEGFFLGFGVMQGILLAAVLAYHRQRNSPANLLMAGFVAAVAMRLLDLWLIRTEFYIDYPGLALVASPSMYLWGPLFYFYAQALVDSRPLVRVWPHLLIFAFMCLPVLSHLFSDSAQQMAVIQHLWYNMDGNRADLPLATLNAPAIWKFFLQHHVHGLLFALQFGVYCLLVIRLIRQHNERLKQHYSSLEEMNLRWLTRLTAIATAFLLLYLLLNRSRILTIGHVDITTTWALIPFFFMVMGIYLIGFMALQQPSLLGLIRELEKADSTAVSKTDSAEEKTAEAAPEPQKYRRSTLSNEDAREYAERLMRVMEEEKLYLDSELTMPELAKQAGLAPYQVSQTLNGPMQQSFFAFVNYYRIELAKQMLVAEETKSLPIVELALEVGFKSKSSFYDAFKRTTKMTPTQYKKDFGEGGDK
jgi:AraC-like DNA-binding protein